MTSEFIGHTSNREGSDVMPTTGPVIDKAYIRNHVQAAESAGIDRLLIGQFAQWPDNNQIAAFVFSQTEKIGALLAHRPGLMAPTLGARQLATLDQFSEGRVWAHIITGGSEADQARDGDFEDHDTRYARTDEYIEVLKKVWESETPFDHEGRFYKFKGAFSQVKPFQKRLPISFGGSSDAAIAVAGKHADIYALWGEPLDGTRETIAKVRAAAVANGRSPDDIKFTLAFRTIVAETEDKAWAQASDILDKVKSQVARVAGGNGETLPSNVGSVRLREAAKRGKVLDKRLWTEVAEASGAGGNSTALVGTAEQVADAILDYYDLGISNFLVRGFYPTEDTVTYGRDVVPLVKAGIAEREARKVAAE